MDWWHELHNELLWRGIPTQAKRRKRKADAAAEGGPGGSMQEEGHEPTEPHVEATAAVGSGKRAKAALPTSEDLEEPTRVQR